MQNNSKYDEKLEKVLAELEMSEFYLRRAQESERYKKVMSMCDGERKGVLSFNFQPNSGSIKLIPLFDVHHGLKGCNVEKLDAYIDLILNTEDCYTFLGGDACETATRDSVGLATFEETMHSGEQRRTLTDKLRPLADSGKILFGIPGNHEMRLQKYNEDNPMVEICYDLEIPYCGYQSYSILKVNDVSYNVAVAHGTGSGGTVGSKVNAGQRPANVAVADLYITGHSHVRAAWDDSQIEFANGAVTKRRRVFVIGGSLVNYFDLYAEQKLLQPGVVGLVLISLDGESKHISVTI